MVAAALDTAPKHVSFVEIGQVLDGLAGGYEPFGERAEDEN